MSDDQNNERMDKIAIGSSMFSDLWSWNAAVTQDIASAGGIPVSQNVNLGFNAVGIGLDAISIGVQYEATAPEERTDFYINDAGGKALATLGVTALVIVEAPAILTIVTGIAIYQGWKAYNPINGALWEMAQNNSTPVLQQNGSVYEQIFQSSDGTQLPLICPAL